MSFTGQSKALVINAKVYRRKNIEVLDTLVIGAVQVHSSVRNELVLSQEPEQIYLQVFLINI